MFFVACLVRLRNGIRLLVMIAADAVSVISLFRSTLRSLVDRAVSAFPTRKVLYSKSGRIAPNRTFGPPRKIKRRAEQFVFGPSPNRDVRLPKHFRG
jgi:hypothetical protein